jgi:hypothetical protein
MNASPSKLVLRLTLAVLVLAARAMPVAAQKKSDEQQVQNQIQRAKIFREAYPLISETDLYCAIYVQEGELPDLRITSTERVDEKILYSDSDTVFLNKGKKDGLEVGQVFAVIEFGDKIGGYGYLAVKRGRAQIVFLEDSRAQARLEKSCGRVIVGDYLLPFEEKESLLGKDLGYEPYAPGDSGAAGNIIYLERDYNQIGSGYWAIIDIGEASGVTVGQQMTIYQQVRKNMPRVGIGNALVIDTRQKTATVKVLSCSDAIRLGYQVQAK